MIQTTGRNAVATKAGTPRRDTGLVPVSFLFEIIILLHIYLPSLEPLLAISQWWFFFYDKNIFRLAHYTSACFILMERWRHPSVTDRHNFSAFIEKLFNSKELRMTRNQLPLLPIIRLKEINYTKERALREGKVN